MKQEIDDLKRRVPIMAVVKHMELVIPVGAPWAFQCPACDAPQARARPDGLGYACRAEGCGHSGDHLTLIMNVRGRSFADALITLSGIAATEERRRSGRLQDDLFGETR